MYFRDITRHLVAAILAGLINVSAAAGYPCQETEIEAEEPPIFEPLKPERVQFWEGLIDNDWRTEREGKALYRTILCDDATHANDLAQMIDDEFVTCGYRADTVEVLGNVLSVCLTTPTVGQLTEQDYAAALMIDTCV